MDKMDKTALLEAITTDLRTLLESNPSQQALVCFIFNADPSVKPVMIHYELNGQEMTSTVHVTGKFHETHVFENIRLKDAPMWPIAAKQL